MPNSDEITTLASPADVRAASAARIAAEVRRNGGEGKQVKVTSLLHAFRVPQTPTKFG